MNSQRIVTVLVAFGMMAMCGFAGAGVGLMRKDSEKTAWTTRSVVAVARDLPAGTVLTDDVLKVIPMPTGFVTAQAVAGDELADLIGQKLEVPVANGAMVRRSFVSPSPTVREACIVLATEAARSASLAGDPEVTAFLSSLDGGAR